MKEIIKTKAECLYVFQGRSCAKSRMIRNLSGAKEFIQSANERFRGYMKIRKYVLSQDTWTMIVELEKSETIRSSYLRARGLSKRARTECVHNEIWKMVSDCVRHWLSRFVKWTNYQDGREGTLRLKRYQRFYFETLEEAEKYVELMIRQEISVSQTKKRFRPRKKDWALCKVGIGHVYLCVSEGKERDVERIFGAGALRLAGFSRDVLRKLIKLTNSEHSVTHAPNYYPKKE